MSPHRSKTKDRVRASDGREYAIVLWTLAGLTVVLQALAIGPLRDRFWGLHLFAFYHPAFAVASWAALVLASFYLLRTKGKAGEPLRDRFLARRPIITALVVAFLCGALFWTFRSQQTLLGDAYQLTVDLPRGQSFHPRQPLTMWIQQMLYQSVGGSFRAGGVSDVEAAHRTVALGSVVAGFFFMLVAMAIGRLFIRDTRHSSTTSLLVALILIAQGYALLFFGYVENYTLFALSIGLYLWLSLLYVRGAVPLVLPALTIVLGTALHLSAAILLPSFGVLVVWGLRQRAKRVAVLRDLVITAAAVVGVQALLSLMNRDYKFFSSLAQISGSVLARKEEGIPHAMFSLAHIRDFVNEQFLIGPLGLFFFVPCAIMALRKSEGRTISSVFLAVAGFTALGASWLAGDSNIGAARNWDLLAPMGICYTAAALYFLLHDVTDGAKTTRMLQFGLLLSLVCFIPWVWINHSEARSLERFKTLPLGLGRTEVVVGNWYGRNQQPKEAEAWFRRALQVYPYNVNAFILLGELYASQKRYDLACDSYAKAVELRPDKESVRVQYVGALFNSGRFEEAVPQLRWLVEKHPDVLGYWDGLGMALSSLGRRDELKEVDLQTAMLLAKAGRGDDALDKFRRVLGTDPDSPAALYNGGMLLMDMGRIDEGRQYLERFIRLYPNDPLSNSARDKLGQSN